MRAAPTPRRGLRGGRASRAGGFTLLELALVLMVVGVLLAFAVPRFPRLGRSDLEASAERLASIMNYLADEASLRGRIYRLTLDLDEDEWQVAAAAPYAERTPGAPSRFVVDADDTTGRAGALPDGVSFDAVLDRDGEDRIGRRDLYFLPEGGSENVAVRLVEREGSEAVVVFDATAGTARVDDVRDVEP